MSTRQKILVVLAGIMLISLITLSRRLPAADLPTATPVPLSSTVSTNTTEPPTSTPVDLGGLVSGTPVPVWKEIPLIPGAIAGSENNGNYLYTTAAAQSEVVLFYTQGMPKLGWTPRPGTGTPVPGAVLTLVFIKGQETCVVAIIPQKVGTLVMLGRQANPTTATPTAAPLPTGPTVGPTVRPTVRPTVEPTVKPTTAP